MCSERAILDNYLNEAEKIYNSTSESLTRYYNKPYNYSKLVAYMSSDFGKLLSTDLVDKVFKSKRSLHIIEKDFTKNDIALEFMASKLNIEEYKQTKKYRNEAIGAGMTTESAIVAHTEHRMTEFYILVEEFNTYRSAINTIRSFFDKENRNVEQLLSQGKALSYSGHKYHDDLRLMGDVDDVTDRI